MVHRYSRDPDYPREPRWDRLYGRHFPMHTDPYSRHARIVCDNLRRIRSPIRKILIDAGYEVDHWANSLEVTIVQLWEARAEIERLKAESGSRED
jgi:hypothetical protein